MTLTDSHLMSHQYGIGKVKVMQKLLKYLEKKLMGIGWNKWLSADDTASSKKFLQIVCHNAKEDENYLEI